MFHLHLARHVEGCGYYYDFAKKTAHIKFPSVSIGCQTDSSHEYGLTEVKYDNVELNVVTYNLITEDIWQQNDECPVIKQEYDCDDQPFLEYQINFNDSEEQNDTRYAVLTERIKDEPDVSGIKQEIIETNQWDCGNATIFCRDSINSNQHCDLNMVQNEPDLQAAISLTGRPRRTRKIPAKYRFDETPANNQAGLIRNKEQEQLWMVKTTEPEKKLNTVLVAQLKDGEWTSNIEHRNLEAAKKRVNKDSLQTKKYNILKNANKRQSKKGRKSRRPFGTLSHKSKNRLKRKNLCSRIYDCYLCAEKTKVMHVMYKHMETVHDGMYQFSCKTCCIPFLKEEKLKEHTKSCRDTNVKSYACIECDNQRLFLSETRFKEHVKKHHDSRNPLKCNICNVHLMSAYHERKHRTEHNKDSLYCQQCRFRAETVGLYDMHVTHHGGPKSLFTCIICNSKSADFGLIYTHYLRHLDNTGDYTCETCGRCFGNGTLLSAHKHVICNKRYICNVCGRRFANQSSLEDHMLYIHEGSSQKPSCDQCGRVFLSRNSLRNHKLSQHSKVKADFTCPHCSKKFHRKTLYSRHLLIHNNLYLHSCSYCEKTFRTKWNKAAHERQHTGAKPYTCTKCGTRFTHNVVRKTHEAKCGVNSLS